MFRCQMCQAIAPPGTPARRVVTAIRIQHYPFRAKANRVVRLGENGKPKVRLVDDPGGVGTAIVRERLVCAACARRRSAL